jgi:hypothetical protein
MPHGGYLPWTRALSTQADVLIGQHRYRHHAVILDLQHAHRIQIYDHHQTLDRARIGVVAGTCTRPAQGTDEPSLRRVVARAIVSIRPGINLRQIEIRHAPAAERGLPLGVLLDEAIAVEHLREGQGWLHIPSRRSETTRPAVVETMIS